MVHPKTTTSALCLCHVAGLQKVGSPGQFHQLMWNNQNRYFCGYGLGQWRIKHPVILKAYVQW